MKDIIDSIRVQIFERLSSPLFGSFAMSWVLWNHRFLMVLFSNQAIEKRFEYIDKYIYTSHLITFNDCVIKPAFTSMLFIYLYPILSKHFYGYWHKKIVELKTLRDEIEKNTLLTVEESQAIRMKMIKTRDQYEDIIENQAKEIETLKNNPANTAEINIYRNEVEHLQSEIAQLRSSANTGEKEQKSREKLLVEIAELVRQGNQFLSQAQNSPSTLNGVIVSEVQSWVDRIGKILRAKYGQNSPELADYLNLTSDKSFYNLHSRNYLHIARMLGIAKSLLNDLNQK